MVREFKIQVPKEYYFETYDHPTRFISYFYQINLAKKLKPSKILEVGIGNKTVTNCLEQAGLAVDTCDFDRELNPDFVADIRSMPFKNESYDLVMACEILEHIPWDDVDKALKELHRVSRKYVIISIPSSSLCFEFILKFPFIQKFFGKKFINLFFELPLFFKKNNFDGEHYWEMGRKGFSSKKIEKVFGGYFKIVKKIRPVFGEYRKFFVLEKKIKI